MSSMTINAMAVAVNFAPVSSARNCGVGLALDIVVGGGGGFVLAVV